MAQAIVTALLSFDISYLRHVAGNTAFKLIGKRVCLVQDDGSLYRITEYNVTLHHHSSKHLYAQIRDYTTADTCFTILSFL